MQNEDKTPFHGGRIAAKLNGCKRLRNTSVLLEQNQVK